MCVFRDRGFGGEGSAVGGSRSMCTGMAVGRALNGSIATLGSWPLEWYFEVACARSLAPSRAHRVDAACYPSVCTDAGPCTGSTKATP